MYHNFFIYSSVDGHLGCFPVLATINSAAMNNGIYVSLSIMISSGYGTPLQYSCLENPMDRGAWWAAIHGVAQLDTTEAT